WPRWATVEAVLSPRRRSASGWTRHWVSGVQRFSQYRAHQLALPTAGLTGGQELVDRRRRIVGALPIPAQPSYQIGGDQVLRRYRNSFGEFALRGVRRIQSRCDLWSAPEPAGRRRRPVRRF